MSKLTAPELGALISTLWPSLFSAACSATTQSRTLFLEASRILNIYDIINE